MVRMSKDKIHRKELCWLLRTLVGLGCTLVIIDSTLYGLDVTITTYLSLWHNCLWTYQFVQGITYQFMDIL